MFKIGDFSRLSQVSIKALRYYDEIGLLKPARIDQFTNYRYYSAEQLPRLNRILALKDLGLSLDQISDLLRTGVTPQQMGDLLRQKHAEIQQQVQQEQQRLARVAARLRQIEQEGAVSDYEVVIKAVPALRIAAVHAVVATYGDIGPLFEKLTRFLGEHVIDFASAYPWLTLYHDKCYRERDVDVTVAAPIKRKLPASGGVQIIELPAVKTMISVIHRGPYDNLSGAYSALLTYLETNHYQIVGLNRSLYLQGPFQHSDPASFVTEIQFPVEPADSKP